MDKPFISYQIEDRSYISYIKREIHNDVVRGKFKEAQVGQIDIIISELTSNIVKHARSGELLYRCHDISEHDSIFEVISIDNGPGILDPDQMMQDGVSTAKTLGQGLGAIKRLSNVAQLYSAPKWGTVMYSLVRAAAMKETAKKIPDLEIKALCVSKPREAVCGDGYIVKKDSSERLIFFGDGLGHGEFAKEAVDRASDFFLETKEIDPVEILKEMHHKVKRTRGLVATIAAWSKTSNEWKVCGVGNILTRMYSGLQYKNLMPYNGVIGLNIPRSMNVTVIQGVKNHHLIMCSDGINSRWDLTKYPSIFKYDNTILAAAIYKDFTRGNDDASILIAKVC
jgi:anti-sigma regulatory factor (Ser/Thr protein kinase)